MTTPETLPPTEKWSAPFPIHYNLHKDFGPNYCNQGTGRIVPLGSLEVHDLARFCRAWRAFRMWQRLAASDETQEAVEELLRRPPTDGYKVGEGFVLKTPGLGTGLVVLEVGNHHFGEPERWWNRLAMESGTSMRLLLPLWSPD